ncbi:MAG: ion transporter [Caldiserica bacterium]|jgi:voltage-gated potassium channel|nr:ion transporter [Caldisericota bacterium]MDH7562588.1 ion transporter [Caldisericota bacterium]
MGKKVKERLFQIMEVADSRDIQSKIFQFFIIGLIFLNVIAVILETEKGYSEKYPALFKDFEIFSVAIFTIEYLLRLWVCTLDERYKGPVKGRIRYALSPMALVDLIAILPFYLPMIIPFDLRFLRALRLFRFFRLLKIWRYSRALKVLGNVFREKKEELLVSVFSVIILLVLSSSLMYFVENEAQPETFSSIPRAMWWAVATLTTVGYGDMYPITPLGKLLGGIIALLGIGLFALPAGIIASGFAQEIRQEREEKIVCPHCGREIEEIREN